jgi:hypothetical protein
VPVKQAGELPLKREVVHPRTCIAGGHMAELC